MYRANYVQNVAFPVISSVQTIVVLLSLLAQSDPVMPDAAKAMPIEVTRTVSGPLTVEETIWGFGTATSSVFNPVAIQVRNDSGDVLEGVVALRIAGRRPSRSQPGQSVERDIFLSPGESRWLNFGAFLVDGGSEWKLVMLSLDGNVLSEAMLPPISFADPKVIAVSNAAFRGALPTFPAARFPTRSTLLDGVYAIVMEEVPAWQPGQETAFAEWLAKGGRAVIGQTATGWPPDLARLNVPLSEIQFGAGRVIRVGPTMDGLTDGKVRELFSVAGTEVIESYDPTRGDVRQTNRLQARYAWDGDAEVFLALDSAATPKSLWLFFFPLMLAYVGAVGWLSMVSKSDRWPIRRFVVVLVITVIVSTAAFAIASPLSGRLASERISMTFVTDLGDDEPAGRGVSEPVDPAILPRLDFRSFTVFRTPISKTVTVPGERADVSSGMVSLESSGSMFVVQDGPSQTITGAVPGVTNLHLRARGVLRMTPPRWAIRGIAPGSKLEPANAAARKLKPIAAMVQSSSSIVRLEQQPKERDGTLVVAAEHKALKDFLVNPSMDDRIYELNFAVNSGREVSFRERILDAAGRAVPSFGQATGAISPAAAILPNGVQRLFVLTETPEEFRMSIDGSTAGACYTVWCVEYRARESEVQ